MKLEYVYYSNSNLKYIIKKFLQFGLGIIILTLIIPLFSVKYIDKLEVLKMFIITSLISTVQVIFLAFLIYIIISTSNNRKRKQFIKIKEKGIYCKAIILKAGLTPQYGRHRIDNRAEISVEANNKVYKIKDIEYNDEFKLLVDILENHLNTNTQKFINIDKQRQDILNKDYNILKNTQIEIDIYVLDGKAVAVLESIKIK